MGLSPLFSKGRSQFHEGVSPFAKSASALRSLPSVALSSDAVKAILFYHKPIHYERYAVFNCLLGDDLIIPGESNEEKRIRLSQWVLSSTQEKATKRI